MCNPEQARNEQRLLTEIYAWRQYAEQWKQLALNGTAAEARRLEAGTFFHHGIVKWHDAPAYGDERSRETRLKSFHAELDNYCESIRRGPLTEPIFRDHPLRAAAVDLEHCYPATNGGIHKLPSPAHGLWMAVLKLSRYGWHKRWAAPCDGMLTVPARDIPLLCVELKRWTIEEQARIENEKG